VHAHTGACQPDGAEAGLVECSCHSAPTGLMGYGGVNPQVAIRVGLHQGTGSWAKVGRAHRVEKGMKLGCTQRSMPRKVGHMGERKKEKN
jgi:hypothetical protein